MATLSSEALSRSFIVTFAPSATTRATIKKLRRTTAENWLVTQHNPADGKSKDFSLLARRLPKYWKPTRDKDDLDLAVEPCRSCDNLVLLSDPRNGRRDGLS